MKPFETPNMTTIAFDVEDVLTTSTPSGGSGGGYAPDSDDTEFG